MEASTTSTSNKVPGQDIEKILREAQMAAMRKTPEYSLGRVEKHKENKRIQFQEAYKSLAPVAELFFSILPKKIKHVKFKELRI